MKRSSKDKKEFENDDDLDDEYGDRPDDDTDSYIDGEKDDDEDIEPDDDELLDIEALLNEADAGEGAYMRPAVHTAGGDAGFHAEELVTEFAAAAAAAVYEGLLCGLQQA